MRPLLVDVHALVRRGIRALLDQGAHTVVVDDGGMNGRWRTAGDAGSCA